MHPLAIILNILVGIVGIVAALVLLELLAQYMEKRKQKSEEYTTLAIRAPRENESGPLVAEQIFSTIHGVARDLSFWERLGGAAQDRVSFEIASVDRMIKFYAHFPSRLKTLVEGQIYAQYPNVEIEEVDDYAAPPAIEVSEGKALAEMEKKQAGVGNGGASVKVLAVTESALAQSVQTRPQKNYRAISEFQYAVGAELKLSDPDIYPIKRYPQFEDKKAKVALDPLASITSTLAKFNDPDEQAWIQIVARPLDDKWRLVYTKCIRILNKGLWLNIEKFQQAYARMYCSRNRIQRILLFPVYWVLGLKGLKAGAGGSLDGGSQDDELEEQTSRTHDRETAGVAAIDKVGRLLYEASVRIVYVPKHPGKEAALVKVREIAGAFKQFNVPHLNGFELGKVMYGEPAVSAYRERGVDDAFVLSVEELATLWHLPNVTVTTPNIQWVRSKRLEPPVDLPVPGKAGEGADEQITLLGRSNFRGMQQPFGIKSGDRRRHIYIIGKTGMGKSTLLENMIYSDIQEGRGVAVVDPHGDLADAVLSFVPSNRTNDVIIFDPSDREFPVAFNMLENIDPSLNSIVCSGLVGIFKKIYADSWGPRLEHILRNTILTLLECQGATMMGIPRILQDQAFRKKAVASVTDPLVKAFWTSEFEVMEPRMRVEAISPILNKVGQFLSSPIIRNILGQSKSAIDLRFAMDKKKIVIVNLSKGKIGEDNSSLLGAMMITKFQLDAMSRANVPEKERTDFYLYVDEFQNFATDSFATILSEARKYKLNLTMANQYIAQMPEEVRDAVFGNVGTMLSFQVGFDDAEYISGQFGEEVLPNDLVGLSKYTAYTRLLIDGMPSKTFSLNTLPPPELKDDGGVRREKIIKLARERYANPRDVVEGKIRKWSGMDDAPKKLSGR